MCFTDPRWKCQVCYSGGNEDAFCDECFATRDGHETVECIACGTRHLAYGVQDHGQFTCDDCGGYDQDLRYHTETAEVRP